MIDKEPTIQDLMQVYNLVVEFIEKHRLTGPDSIYQSDRVYEYAPELVEDLANVVGYYDDGDEDEESKNEIHTENTPYYTICPFLSKMV